MAVAGIPQALCLTGNDRAVHGSDAHYCPHCGLAFAGPRSIAGMGDPNVPYPAPLAGPGQAALFDPSAAPPETAVQPSPGTHPGS